MKFILSNTLLFMLLIGVSACSDSTTNQGISTLKMVDTEAGVSTRNLYRNLHKYSGQGLMFGHQATLDYGYTWHSESLPDGTFRSDVNDVSGSFPAVYGWDVNYVANPTLDDSTRAKRVAIQLARDRGTFERGGILTY